MKIIEPLTIAPQSAQSQSFALRPAGQLLYAAGEQFLVSDFVSNVPEDDYPAWAPGTYAAETWVMHNHRVWQATKETDKEPGTADAANDWNDGGYTNMWRMFDDKVSTATVNPGSIEVSMAPGTPVTDAAFFNVDAGIVNVQVVDPYDGIIFDRDVTPVSTEGIDNWHAYFFKPIELISDFVLTNIPGSSFSTIKIEARKADDMLVSIGSVVLGAGLDIGHALYGTSIGIIDYSYKDTNDYGDVTVVERGYSKRAEFDVAIDTKQVGKVQRALAKYRARPIVWIGEVSLESTIIYGYYKSFDIVISNPAISDCTISVEGLN